MTIKEIKKAVEESTGYPVDDIELGAKEITVWNSEVGVIAVYKRKANKLIPTQTNNEENK